MPKKFTKLLSRNKSKDDPPPSAAPGGVTSAAPVPSRPAAAPQAPASQRAPPPAQYQAAPPQPAAPVRAPVVDPELEQDRNLMKRLQDVTDQIKTKELALTRAEKEVKTLQLEWARTDEKQKVAYEHAFKKYQRAKKRHESVAADISRFEVQKHTIETSLSARQAQRQMKAQNDVVENARLDEDEVADTLAEAQQQVRETENLGDLLRNTDLEGDSLGVDDIDMEELRREAQEALAEEQGGIAESKISAVGAVPTAVPSTTVDMGEEDEFAALASDPRAATAAPRRTPAAPY